MEPKLNPFAMAAQIHDACGQVQISLTRASAIVIAFVIFVTAFLKTQGRWRKAARPADGRRGCPTEQPWNASFVRGMASRSQRRMA